MGIELHRADRPEALAGAFAALLRTAPADVFSPEVVVVAARGVERWLAQQLSHSLGSTIGDDGVCAGLQILAPQSLISLLLGRDRDDPWQADRLVWPVLAGIDELVGSAHFTALTRHLGAGPPIAGDAAAEWERTARQSRRYAVARRIAGLFASYARERPRLVADWEAGKDTDGQGADLPDDFRWQPILWRRAVEIVLEQGDAQESVVERHRRVVRELTRGRLALDLPARLSFFGHTRLAASELQLLFALGTHREVHLWLPHPSPQLWQDLSRLTVATGVGLARADDTSASFARHPLLATLGRDVRELEETLAWGQPTVHDPAPSTDRATTRLGLLQADIRANRAPDQRRTTDAGDLSIQVHACHGRSRQVEVLREVLLWLIAEDEGDLQPRDILVMCPDIEHFAPLIQAAFGLSLVAAPGTTERPHHPGQQLRVQLADRSLRATNPLVDLAHRILDVVAGRMTATDVLGLATHAAVRARFGFDEDSLALLGRWVTDSGVRWGYDGDHRAEYGLRGVEANTWARGLDRIALGVAVAADSAGPSAARVPIDDIGSRDIEVVGRFLELMDRLKAAADVIRLPSREDPTLARGVRTAPEWMDWLGDTVESLAATPPDDGWQLAQLRRDLAVISDSAGARARLRLSDIRVLLDQRWAARPSRANFRTGAVTVCTMVPMRSVPHKAVVVLGIDDDVYPRSPITDGDDILARRPMVGERDARSEDRQLLLDAVMAAGEHFVAIYSGFDERTGSRRPPAVPLQELIAAADRTATVPASEAEAGPAPEAPPAPGFVRHHPLQAFDERNFRPGGPLPGGTFDRLALEGAQALRDFHRKRPDPPVFLSERLPARPVSAVTVDELVAFLQNPAREFLRDRLEVTVARELEETNDAIPIAMGGLDTWEVGGRVLAQVLGGVDLDDALEREATRGSLPPGVLGHATRTEIQRVVESITADRGQGPPRSVDVRVDLPAVDEGDPVRLTGVVPRVHGDTLWAPTYSTISAKHVAAAWVRLLALAVAEPEHTHTGQLSGKKGGLQLSSPGAARAIELLRDLVWVRQCGLRFPLGIPPKTASEFTLAYRPSGPDDGYAAQRALGRARGLWEGDRFPGENADPWWSLVLGTGSRVEALDRLEGLSHFGPLVWGPIHAHGGTP